MDECPFQLRVERLASPGVEQLTCVALLRAVPGTRYVYDALWNDRPVIIKLFCRRFSARRHVRREWRGLKRLEERQLDAPKPLFCGRTPRGWAVVTEKIENTCNARQLWDQCRTSQQKTDLLCRISRELAQQHGRGVIQTDMHLGNFLIRGAEVFILDPATMRFGSRELSRSRSIEQLAELTSIFDEEQAAAVENAVTEYARVRGWSWWPGDLPRLHAIRRRHRSRTIERALKKFLRSNKRHRAIRRGRWHGIAERAFLEAAGEQMLTARLDEAMQRGEIYKEGRTSFVSRTELGGFDVVVKRYNHKGLFHSLRHTLKGSRARQGWVHVNRLHLLDIPTPRPLAYIDEYRGPLLWRSYLVTEYLAGQSLHGVLRDPTLPEAQKQRWIQETVGLMDRLAGHGITHGDMKHTNILCSGNTVVLTDLDAMQVHRAGHRKQGRYRRDKARFLRDLTNWCAC